MSGSGLSACPPAAARALPAPKLRTSCDNCHSLKVKCGQEKPRCSRCRSSDIDCVYGVSLRAGKKKNQSTRMSCGTITPRQRSQPQLVQTSTAGSDLSGMEDCWGTLHTHERQPAFNAVAGLDRPNTATQPSTTRASTDTTLQPFVDDLVDSTDGLGATMESFLDVFPAAGRWTGTLQSHHTTSFSSAGYEDESALDLLTSELPACDDSSWPIEMSMDSPSMSNLFASFTTMQQPPPHPSPVPTAFGPAYRRPSEPSHSTILNTQAETLQQPTVEAACEHHLLLLQALVTVEHASHPRSALRQSLPGSAVPEHSSASTVQPQPNSRLESTPANRAHQGLTLDKVLRLGRDSLNQCAVVFSCKSCLSDYSCFLLLTILLGRTLRLYQAGAGAYGVCAQHHAHKECQRRLELLEPRLWHHELPPSIATICDSSRIRIGENELGAAEQAALVKDLVKIRVNEVKDLLLKLNNEVAKLPNDGGRGSACKAAVCDVARQVRLIRNVLERCSASECHLGTMKSSWPM